jgi:chromosome partitioning protein
MTLDAARIADFILIPTKCGILDLQAVSSSVDMASIAKRPAAIVLCAVPVRGATAEQAREALKPLGLEVCPITTGDRAAYRNALVSGLTAQNTNQTEKQRRKSKPFTNG